MKTLLFFTSTLFVIAACSPKLSSDIRLKQEPLIPDALVIVLDEQEKMVINSSTSVTYILTRS